MNIVRAGVWIEAVCKIQEHVNKETILDIADHEEKVYSSRSAVMMEAYRCSCMCRRDEPGIVITYYYTSAEFCKL